MLSLLTFLMKTEREEEATEAEALFKAQVFANNPEHYARLYGEDAEEEPYEIEEIVPETPEDVERLINQMRREEGRDRKRAGPGNKAGS